MPLQLPAPKTPLHLYRHLLREASYLPPVIRPCFTERIIFVFRRHRNDSEPMARIRKGTQKLRTLRAAVAGDRDSLEKVIQIGFGRIGFRRRQLLSDFLHREPPQDSTALQEFLDWKLGIGPAPKHLMKFRAREGQDDLTYDWLDGWDTDKLTVLLKAQADVANPPKTVEIRTKRFEPYSRVPELNGYGLPFPPKPARTKVKNFWKVYAEKALPPVPKEEWNILRDLAHGKDMARGQVLPRRPVAGLGQDIDLELAKQSWDMENYLLQPARWVDRKSSHKRVLFTGIPQPNDELGHAPEGLSSQLTPRNMRRIYGAVWRLTPFIEKQDGSASGWKVTFGQPRTIKNNNASQTWHQVFQGVNQDGVPITETAAT
ncbi:hypothetical protein PpBr36_04048 [Pyricularia pennisetigena]|uniref:hypothetical protein n=1 Tax=Pyricularia pennisetigena TaxID=1578925 RepID=UPI00114F81F3|nr:hypothetical protein PpBr36_04048 [Pyricularia pennisetigena]TLS27489.1 hypothetical protein PpBr36_04048 [Pyricularia pennisetigena]